MNDEKIILVMPRTIISTADNETAYIRFSCSPGGKDMTAGRFDCQQYVGFAINEREPTDERDLSWMKIIGKAFDGKSGFTAVQIVYFVKALGKCAYIDRGDCAVTQEVRRLLLGEEQYLVTFDVEGERTEVAVRGGDVPIYPGETPQKESTVQNEYTFSGWEPPLVPAIKDATYCAVFEETTRAYPITWLNYDGQVLATDLVAYGETPVYRGDVPVKEEDERYYYVFSVWEPTVQAVSGAAGYTATFVQVERTYSVKWLVEGVLLKEDLLTYGQIPQYTGEPPQKEPSGKEKYTFSRWEPEVSEVIGDTVYTAVFASEPNYTGLAVEYDDMTPIATNTVLTRLGYTVRAVYADGTQTEPLRQGADYGIIIAAPTGGTWTIGVENTVAVTGIGAYDGLSATFTVTVENAYTLQLTRDGTQNATLLQNALDTYSNVKLITGSYPLDPLAVTVDSGMLDMNGSILTSTSEKYSGGGLINLRGTNPTIKNGELAGLYDEPDQAGSTSVVWERESLVSLTPCGYSNAVVENMKLHNCWGYAICERGTAKRATWKALINDDNMDCDTTANYVGGKITKVHGGYEYVSRDFDLVNIPEAFRENLQPPYQRICAHYAGYFRIISDKKIEYSFKNSDGETIGEPVLEVPGMPVKIPEGAKTATIKAFWADGNEKWHHYVNEGTTVYQYIGLWFMKDWEGGLSVKNCQTYHNYSLGMVGASTGKTSAQNCVSWGNGKPYDGATDTVRSTTGFIDIEDIPSPFIELDHCYSNDETHFAMLGAYNTKVANCSGKDVIIYCGWGADISTDEGAFVMDKSGVPVAAGVYTSGVGTSSASVTTPVSVSNCRMGSFNSGVHAPANVVGEKCVFEQLGRRIFISANSKDNFDGFKVGKNIFKYNFSMANVMFGDISGDWDAEISVHFDGSSMPSIGYLFGSGKFATDVNTTLFINATCDSGPAMAAAPIKVTGNCYGLRSNVAILPNGNAIVNSTFNTDFPLPFTGLTVSSGTFDTCTFNTEHGSFVRPINQHVTSGSLTFKNCTIHNAKNFLLGATGTIGWTSGVVLTFENCGIADTEKLAYGTPTINLIGCWPIQSD